MAMVRFDPFRDLAVLQDRMNRLFNDAYSPRQSDDLTSRGTWTTAVDIYEVNGGLVLKAELPDMTREDIDVSVENKSEGFTHGFVVTFRDAKGRDAYLPHPAHQEFVKLVGPRLEKALVFDYWTAP